MPQTTSEMAKVDGAREADAAAGELRAQVVELSRRIEALAQGQQDRLDDIALAQETAQAIKPYVDRLVALKRLLDPVHGIVEKRQQIHELQAEIAADVAAVENLATHIDGEAVPADLAGELQGEIAAIKRDRKLFVRQIDAAEQPAQRPPAERGSGLSELPVGQRLARIFGERFLPLERLEGILSIPPSPADEERYDRELHALWALLFERDELRPHVEQNRVKSLATVFADYALLFRSPTIGNGKGEILRCSLAALRARFPAFFTHPTARKLWYGRHPFYRQPIERGHWALVDRQYLNCTFKKPSIRLLMYARANGLPARTVRQKSAAEDVYDRIVLELALRERFFDNCHSMTRTTYQDGAEAPAKQVYIFYKDDVIRISGKSGTPHWKPTRPRWPGVYPSISPPAAPA